MTSTYCCSFEHVFSCDWPSGSLRDVASRSAIVVSAVASVSTFGVYPTFIPRLLISFRSRWSKPTDMVPITFTLSPTKKDILVITVVVDSWFIMYIETYRITSHCPWNTDVLGIDKIHLRQKSLGPLFDPIPSLGAYDIRVEAKATLRWTYNPGLVSVSQSNCNCS